jgi:hypothetical protein
VSWAAGGDYVGWCPLGYQNRPVVLPPRVKGYAVPRGSVTAPAAGATSAATIDGGGGLSGFNFVRKSDMGSPRLAERRFVVPGEAARAIRVSESPRALNRELKLGEAPAASVVRPVKTRPTFGDTAPEPRGDPATAIPPPIRRREAEAADKQYEARPPVGSRPTDLRSPREAAPASRQRDAAPELWRGGSPTERRAHPTDQRSPRWEYSAPRERDAAPQAPRAEPQRPGSWLSSETTQERDRSTRERNASPAPREPAHDVLRRFFEPANPGRSRGESSQGSTQRSEPPRPSTPQRVEPRSSSAPPSAPKPKSESPRASRPKKEKDN